MASFCVLNDDCLREIFKYVGKFDILSLLQVSQRIKMVAIEFISKFMFDSRWDKDYILRQFEQHDAIEIFGAIRRLQLDLTGLIEKDNKRYSLLTKNLNRLDDLEASDSYYWRINYHDRWNKSPTKQEEQSLKFEFLRQVRDLKRLAINGLKFDTETAEMFVSNNQTIEYVQIDQNCKGINAIAKLPKVHTIYYHDDDDSGDGFHIKIAQMISLKTLMYAPTHCDYKIEEIVDQLAITNVVEHLFIVISEKYDPLCLSNDDYFGEEIEQLELPAKMTNLKSFSFRNHTDSEVELKLIVRNLPELEYLENCCYSWLDAYQIIDWLRNCPLLKEINCLGLNDENIDSVATEMYLKIEDYLVINNRSLTLNLDTSFPIEQLQNSSLFQYLKFKKEYNTLPLQLNF